MNFRFSRFLFALCLSATLSISARAAEWALSGSLLAHDPTVIKDGSTWWCFTTGTGIPTLSSPDGKTWTTGSPIFTSELSWWRTYAPQMGHLDVWAPDLEYFNGRYWLYYAVSEFGTNNSAIGLMSCTSINKGDWKDEGLVISSQNGSQAYNAIDPNLTIDADGKPWLVFGSWFSGIQIVPLDPSTMKPNGSITTIAQKSGGIEGSNVVYANGYYYLFVSIGICCQGVNSTYQIAYGRSKTITGPYVDKSGTSMLNGGCTIFESSGTRWKGPGGQDVSKIGSGWIIARHAYDADNAGAPTLRIADLYWDADAWPAFSVTGAPTVLTQPVGATIVVGLSLTLSVDASGQDLTYQWYKDGVAISGGTESSYTLSSAAAADNGSYTVKISNGSGSVTSTAAVLAPPPQPTQVTVPTGDGTAQIINLSTRGIVSTGLNSLIAGFVISGPSAKKLLIIARGYTLGQQYSIPGTIGRPDLTLNHEVSGNAQVVVENSDWQTDASEITAIAAQVGAQPLMKSSDPSQGDAGVVVTLNPGVYTVVVVPAAQSSNQDGIGLVELYDVTPDDGSRLINISTRGSIETGARQMIVGVVIRGTGHSRLLIRGVGPTLVPMGVATALENPSETLYQMSGGPATAIGSNDDWWNSAQADQMVTIAQQFGAFALGSYSTDSSMLVRLTPGVYTAIISPGNQASGVALAEIYDANSP